MTLTSRTKLAAQRRAGAAHPGHCVRIRSSRIVAPHHRSPTSYQIQLIHENTRCLYF
jgi:hypothetical protein